jgi:hypothetical protein
VARRRIDRVRFQARDERRGNRVGGRHEPADAIVLEQVRDAHVAQQRDGRARHDHQRRLVVEARAERLAGLEDEIEPAVRGLRLAA